MDPNTVSALTNTSVEGGAVTSLWQNLGGLLNTAAGAYLDKEFDLSGRQSTRDVAIAELQAGQNAQMAISQTQIQTALLIGGALVAAVVLYRVLK